MTITRTIKRRISTRTRRTSARAIARTTKPRTHLLSQHVRPLQAISPFPIHEVPGKIRFLPSSQTTKTMLPLPSMRR